MERQLGYLLVLSVPLAAGVATSRGMEISGFNYSGFIWILHLLAGLILIVVEKTFHRDSRCSFPVTPWAIGFGFLWLSLCWGDSLGRRNVQDALQISMPLLMAIVGNYFIRSETELRRLMQAFGWALVPLAIMIALTRPSSANGGEDDAGLRLLGLSAGLVGCVFLSRFPQKFFTPLLGFGASAGVAFLSGGRTIVAALLFVSVFHPLIRGIGWRSLLMAGVLVAGLAVFNSETFQQRFFYSGRGTIADLFQGQVRGAGRFEAWPQIWEEAARRPILGHGVGSAYSFVPTVWIGMNHVHNEYLRLIFEAGIIGLTLFVSALFYQIVDLTRQLRKSTGLVQAAFAASYLGLLLFAMTALTGNPLPSNVWFMNPLFVLMGAAYGVASRQAEQAEIAALPPPHPSATSPPEFVLNG